MTENRNWRWIAMVAVGILLGTGGAVLAQDATGNLYGTVTDQEGAPLPGATVTVTGLGAPRVQASDAQGDFRFLGLDPGSYSMQATLEGFSTVEYPSINIRVGRNTEVRVTLTSAIEEVITVTSESPLLDERKLMTGTAVSQIELEKIPTARDPWAILNQTPGVMVDRINVGGNESGQQAVFLGQGVSDDENDFLVDGVQITDMAAIGASPTYYDFDQFAEMQFATGGTDVTKNAAGVSVNLVTKRGSNEFRGSARFMVTDGEGQFGIFDQADPEVDASEFGPGQTEFIGNRISRIEDYGFEAGGPVVRDHLWLWGSWGTNDIKNLVPGAGPGGLISDDTILENTSIKLNTQLSSANSAVASWNNGDKQKFGRSAGPTRPPETTWNQRGPSALWKVEDTHIFGSNFFLTGTWSKMDGGFSLAARGGAGDDALQAWRDGSNVWHDGYLGGGSSRPSTEYKADGSYFFNTGQATGHEIKFGGRYREFETVSPFSWPGGDIFSLALGGGSFPLVVAHRGLTPPITQEYTSLWVQDTISSGRMTYNAGLRYDVQTGSNDPIQIRANPLFPEDLPALDYGGEDAAFEWEDIQPRLGATYALGEERKTLLRGSFAQFAEQLSTDDIFHTNPAGDAYVYFLNLTDYAAGPNPNHRFDPGDQLLPIDFVGVDPTNPGALISPNVADPNLEAPITSDLILGVEHALLPEFVVGLNLIRRETDDIKETRPFVREGDGTVRVATAADYVPDYDPDTGQPIGPMTGTLPDGSPFSVDTFALRRGLTFTGGGLLTNGDRSIEFNGVGLTFTKRLANRWMARGNFQWGEAEWDLGSEFLRFDDPNPGETGGDTDISSDVDGGLVGVVSAGSGAKDDVVLQSTWSANLNGMYQIAPERPWGFNVAANLNAREGYVLPYFLEVTGGDGKTRDEVRVVNALDDFRADEIFTADLRIDKDLSATDDLSLTLSAELFNAFNENYVMQRERDLGVGSADWLRETLSPRIWRIGARLSWK